MPIQRIRVLAGISVMCVVSHWTLVQFVIGGDVSNETILPIGRSLLSRKLPANSMG